MAICSFFGHKDIYDTDIDAMLLSAVEKVIEENETVEFLVYQHGSFYNRCFLAALKARSCYPEKVTIALVLHEDYFEGQGKYAWKKCEWIPLCMVDRVVVPPVEKTICQRRDTSLPYRQVVRWLMKHSTHLISYLYRGLFGAENRLLDRAEAMPALTIIDISRAETALDIAEHVWQMPDRERRVYQALAAGYKNQHISEQMGITNSRVSQILQRGCHRISEHLNWRYLKTLYTDKEKRSCSIFFVDRIPKEILKNFDEIIDFLIEVYEVRNFYLEASHSRSRLVRYIKKHSTSARPLRILAVIDGSVYDAEDDTELEMTNIMVDVCPPCDAAVYVNRIDSFARPMGVIPDIMELSDFCLCNFSEISCTAELQKCVTRLKRTVLLDLNKACIEFERLDIPCGDLSAQSVG